MRRQTRLEGARTAAEPVAATVDAAAEIKEEADETLVEGIPLLPSFSKETRPT
jgi:hypothetical protein